MKTFLKNYRHLASLAVVLTVGTLLFGIHALSAPGALLCIGAFQLSQLCLSERSAFCFETALTSAQIKEFERIIGSLKGYEETLRELENVSDEIGGLDALKSVPGLAKRLDELSSQNKRLIKGAVNGLGGGGSGPVLYNGKPGVADDCARHLAALAITSQIRRGGHFENQDTLEGISREILGMEIKAPLTTSDIPLPNLYSGQVVELVSQYGDARRYGTVYPLGAGTVKLPKLSTDPTFGLIAASGTVTEKSPQVAFVTFNAEKFGGLVRIPAEIDADSIVPIGQFIARYAARNIARVEDNNFFVGTGADSGINGAVAGLAGPGASASTVLNSKVLQMASTKTHYSDATLANFRALRAIPDEAAIRTGAYYIHSSFEQLFSSFNTSGDKPYNPAAQFPGASAAQPFMTGPTLDGYPIRWVPVMPAYSTGANASTVFALFGDASYQYLGVRGGIRFDTSMEAGFATDEILMRALERFTIGLMANGAVAGLETAAS